MRLQLITQFALLIVIALIIQGPLMGQGAEPDSLKQLQEAEINILFSYYTQDGNHSPVTGGTGTEHLTDITPRVVVTVPINEKLTLNMDAGVDSYTSASTDKIDNRISSASIQDTRIHGSAGITSTNLKKGFSYNLRLGGSTEYDYTSIQIGGGVTKTSRNGNREFSASAQAFIDRWILFFPVELRGENWVETKQRQSFNLTFGYAQVLTKRLQASLSAEFIYQRGLLATPFHRVYFKEQDLPRVEDLPGSRVKVPIGILNELFPE